MNWLLCGSCCSFLRDKGSAHFESDTPEQAGLEAVQERGQSLLSSTKTKVICSFRVDQEIITDISAMDLLHSHQALYLVEAIVAEACKIPIDSVRVTGITDKLFPNTQFLDDGSIIVQYAVVISIRIMFEISVEPMQDPCSVGASFVKQALIANTNSGSYFHCMNSCIPCVSSLADAEIVPVSAASIVGSRLDASITPEVSRQYFSNHGSVHDMSSTSNEEDRRKDEQCALDIIANYREAIMPSPDPVSQDHCEEAEEKDFEKQTNEIMSEANAFKPVGMGSGISKSAKLKRGGNMFRSRSKIDVEPSSSPSAYEAKRRGHLFLDSKSAKVETELPHKPPLIKPNVTINLSHSKLASLTMEIRNEQKKIHIDNVDRILNDRMSPIIGME